MNVLDENVAIEQAELLDDWHIPARHIGCTLGRQGMKDEAIIPFLLTLRRPTLFTSDPHFYKRSLCHGRYCLVYVDVGADETAAFVRRLLRHPEFDTQAKRLGAVIRVSHIGIAVWRLHTAKEFHFNWT